MTQLDFWLEGLPVSPSASQDSGKDLKTQEEILPLPMLEFLTSLDPSGAFGKTCQVSSVSNGGRDFGSFLGALAELGYGFAYRVLDAQNFGVPQRRRRVFVVGCLGDWESAAKVLFESDCLSGDNKKSRAKREATATYSERGIAYGGSDGECADTVTSKWAKGSGGPQVMSVAYS